MVIHLPGPTHERCQRHTICVNKRRKILAIFEGCTGLKEIIKKSKEILIMRARTSNINILANRKQQNLENKYQI